MNIKQKNTFIKVFLLLLIFITMLSVFQHTAKKSQRYIALGMWTEGFFDPKTKQLHPEQLRQLEQKIHKKVSIAHYYIGWEALTQPNLVKQFDTLQSNGWEPMLNVNPYYFSECPASSLPLYKAIAEGTCDTFLHKAGKNLRTVKQPFYLLFAWEMNNKDLEWSTTYSGSTPADFIAAWRHMHDIFRQEQAKNVVWVFCPNVPDDKEVTYQELYPGNEYVDWIGLDGYNWGTTQSWSQWASFAGVFTSSYNHLTAIAPSKPLMIAEVNTTDQGGNKSAWYTDMLTEQIPYHFPHIQAVVIFNENRTQQEKVNWNIDVTQDTLHAFTSGIHSIFY